MPSTSCGTVRVLPAFEERNVKPTCPSLPDEVRVGEEFDLEWEITNENDDDARVEYELLVAGGAVESDTITVGDSERLTTAVVIEEIDGDSEDVPVEVAVTSAERA